MLFRFHFFQAAPTKKEEIPLKVEPKPVEERQKVEEPKKMADSQRDHHAQIPGNVPYQLFRIENYLHAK